MVFTLPQYIVRVTPAYVLAVALMALLPANDVAFRIITVMMLFIVSRDAMTPAGFWELTLDVKRKLFRLRFVSNASILLFLAFGSLGTVLLLNAMFPKLAALITWLRPGVPIVPAGMYGSLAAFVIAAPFVIMSQATPKSAQKGLVIPIMLLAMLGNLLEEVIFRGYFQGYLEHTYGMQPVYAGLMAGLAFAYGHVFLALTVTDGGIPVLLFCLFEGCICGLLTAQFGVVSAVFAHGGGIFMIAMFS